MPVPALLGGLLAAYLIVPVALTLTRLGPGQWQGIGDRSVWAALGTSALASTIAMTVAALAGVPLAWVLARRRPPGWARRLWAVVGTLVQLPLALPPLVSGLLLIRLVGPYTFLGRHSGERLTETLWGIVLAQIFVAGPFLIVAARGAFSSVDPALEAVAATLGHRGASRFFRVDVAEAFPGIRAGLVLTWLRSFGEFGATVLLAYHPYSLPVYIYVAFDGTGLPATQVPVDLAIATAIVVVAIGQIRRRRRPPSGLPAPVAPTPARSAPLDFDVDGCLGDFRVRAGHQGNSSRLALLGPSGAGKSLTLKLLAGVQAPTAGWVRIGADELSALRPERRGIGYVPQGGGLLPHLDVWRQVTFAVDAHPAEAVWWLDRLGLTGLEGRYPAELSGGQAQRVALARALASPTRLLLLDEPLSALDTPVRRALRAELRRLQLDTGLASVVVTHDAEEAAALADDIVVLDAGRVLQAGARREVFGRPNSVAVARLLGLPNVHDGTLVGPGLVAAGRPGSAPGGTRPPVLPGKPPEPAGDWAPGVGPAATAAGRGQPGSPQPPVGHPPLDRLLLDQPVLWSVDPDEIVPAPRGRWPALVVDVVDLGRRSEALLDLGGDAVLTCRHQGADDLVAGTTIRVDLPPVDVWASPSLSLAGAVVGDAGVPAGAR